MVPEVSQVTLVFQDHRVLRASQEMLDCQVLAYLAQKDFMVFQGTMEHMENLDLQVLQVLQEIQLS